MELDNKYYFPYFVLILNTILWGSQILLNYICSNKITFNAPYVSQLSFSLFSFCEECKNIRYQFWRLITYSFIHLNLDHLLNNSLVFLIFGSIVEIVNGHLPVLIIYFLSTIFAAISISYFCPYIHLIGSSAGIYGIIGSSYSYFVLNFVALNHNLRISILMTLLIILICEIIFYLYFSKNGIAYSTHFIGLIYGFLIGNISFKPIKKFKYHSITKIISFALLLCLTAFFLIEYITLKTAKNKKYSHECCFIN